MYLKVTQGKVDFADNALGLRKNTLHATPAEVLMEGLQDPLFILGDKAFQSLKLVCWWTKTMRLFSQYIILIQRRRH